MPELLLGIDSGCTMSKAALFSLDGREVAVASRKTPALSPRPGFLERSVEEMWRATADTIREVLDDSGASPGDVACVAVTGHGNGLYLVDSQGRPVRDAILSTDSRARSYIEEWERGGIGEQVRPKTMQSIWPAQPNALLAWLQDNEPETMRRARWVLMAKDYIRFELTGEVRAELTDMSGTSLLNVATGDYDTELLAAFGIADLRDRLPPLGLSAEILGQVTSTAASRTGLKEGTPVAGGLFDIDACGLASGLVDEKPVSIVAGTWGNNQFISTKPVISPDVFMTSRYSIPGYYLMLEGSATSASNLEWFVTELVGDSDGSAFERCNELVAATDPEKSGVVFLPFLYGSNAGPDATSCFIGMRGWHGRGDLLRSVYEGVVFAHKTHIDRLLKFRDPPEAIRLTGGAARSDVWLGIFADCLQTPIQVPEGTELGALGAAICAGVASGCFAGYGDAIEKMVRFSRTQEPDPRRGAVYEEKLARYRKVLQTLAPVWGELA